MSDPKFASVPQPPIYTGELRQGLGDTTLL
jgi:hypothetical protein